jgi:hypothetical protein
MTNVERAINAVSEVVCRREDMGHEHFVDLSAAIRAAFAATPAVGGEALKPFIDALDSIDKDTPHEQRCADDTRMGQAIWEFELPTVGDLRKLVAAAQPACPLRGREWMAEVVYEGAHKGLKNCWKWTDDGLDHEHPGRRGYYYKIADAVLASLSSAPPEERALPLRVQETCLECGTCDPCDDDCPNYIEPTA